MANTDTELKKLNKTVDDAVNILKIYVGNSAQIKSMNEKERQAINKWFDVVTEEEEQQKQKRKFTERLRDENGKFIKKQDDQAKKFLGMAGMVKGMFKTMTVGVAMGIGKMAMGIKNHFQNFFSALKSHFLGLFGEESEWFELLGSIKDSIKGFAVGTFKFFFSKTPKWASKMLKTLSDMYKLQIKEMKMDFLEGSGKKKKGDVWTTLGIILFTIAAGLGAWLHRKLIAITSSIPIFAKLGNLFTGLKKIPFFAKIGEWITKLKGYSTKFMDIAKKMPILGRIIKGLKFGFKWLGWPVTLLMSIFDFIKGFKDTEGTLWDKIKGGLWEALKGFIELPVKFIGWLVEKVAGWFGIEIEGVADNIMNSIQGFLDFILDFNPFAPIIDFFEGFFGTEGTFMEKIKAGADNVIKNIGDRIDKWFGPILDSISSIVSGVAGTITNLWNKIFPGEDLPTPTGGGQLRVAVPDPFGKAERERRKQEIWDRGNTLSPIDAVNKTESAKIKNNVQSAKSMEQAVDAIKEMERNRKSDVTKNTLAAMSQNNQSGGGGDVKQIPDEIDNGLVSVKNYSGELD